MGRNPTRIKMTTKINEEILKDIKSQRKKIRSSIYSNETMKLKQYEKELEVLLNQVRAEKKAYISRDKYAMKDLRVVK